MIQRVQGEGFLVKRAEEYVRVGEPVEGETIFHGDFVEWQKPLPEPRGYSGRGDDTTYVPGEEPPPTTTVFLPVDPSQVTAEVYKPEVTITVF